MKLYTYNENCTRAGQRVSDERIEKHGEDCCDWSAHEGAPEELLEYAAEIGEIKRDEAGRATYIPNHYSLAVARSIREAVYWEHPELEPEESEEDDDADGGEYGDLHDYTTGRYIRPATAQEQRASRAEVECGHAEGVIRVDGVDCYVED